MTLREPEFFDSCLAPGMPESDPCLGAQCLRNWFVEGSCSDDLCCVQDFDYGTPGLLCP